MATEQTYVLDGPTEFFFPFPVRTASELVVSLKPGNVLPASEYQVIGASATSNGVTVKYPNAPRDGLLELVISRESNIDRVSVFLDDLSITARALNAEFDNILNIIQDGFASEFGRDLILQPQNVSPADDSTDVSRVPTLVASDYFSLYGIPMKSATWQVSEFASFSTTVVDEEVLGTATSFSLSTQLGIGENYFWRVQYKDQNDEVSEFSEITSFVTTSEFVATPTITTPPNGTSGLGTQPLIESSAFAVSPGDNDTHIASQWVITRVSDSTVVFDSGEDTSNLTSIIPPAGVLTGDPATQYIVEVRHKGQNFGYSLFSPGSTFTVDVYIEQPSITQPTDGETGVSEQPTYQGSSFTIINASEPHQASQWVTTRVSDGVVVDDTGTDTVNLTTYQLPAGILDDGQTEYEVKVRYKSASYAFSEYSAPVSFTTKPLFQAFLYVSEEQQSFMKIDLATFQYVLNDIFERYPISSSIAGDMPMAYREADGFLYIGTTEPLLHKVETVNGDILDSSFTLTDDPRSVVVDDAGFVYVVSQDFSGTNIIYKFDVNDLSTDVARFTTSDRLDRMAYDDGFIYIVTLENTVLKIQVSDMTQVDTSPVLEDFLRDIVIKNGFLFVTGHSAYAYKLDKTNMQLLSQKQSTRTGKIRWRVTADDTFLYTGEFDSGSTDILVEKLNQSDLEIVDTTAIPNASIRAILYYEGALYVAEFDNLIYKFDPADFTQLDSIANSGNSDDYYDLVIGA